MVKWRGWCEVVVNRTRQVGGFWREIVTHVHCYEDEMMIIILTM